MVYNRMLTPNLPATNNSHSNNRKMLGAADPFFHTPTPPAPQPQESAYGAFGQLGQQMQHQAQAQASHLGGFGGDYGYGDNQRGFYDSYGQQAGFNGRNTLGHDDMKGGPVSQQPASNVGISATASQTSQHSAASQASVQPQAVAGQAPQQYPPPLPYYYNPYPQNQFYGTPYNSGYGVHNYVKYPAAMFAGGPASGPTPAAKQPGNVQPQSNPYGQGLYTQHQQHPSASYEEIGYQHHSQQPHGLSAGLPSNEYGKQQLYGGQGGFMGLGQSNGPAGGVRNTGGGSPETPYKPYAPKDVGGGVGGGMGVNQGIQGGRAGSVQGQQPSQVGQSQGQGQPQQGQGNFYSNRYAANAGAGVGVGAGVGGPQGQAAHHLHQPQGQGPQSHLAYPQGGSEANFYSYQARQQGYWPQ
ncbi:hypothetical protein ONZ45_g18257 [Pleurotus djamor]|nr:hypothetical protein ONZ45_g18257 [Pleurotus djamor]